MSAQDGKKVWGVAFEKAVRRKPLVTSKPEVGQKRELKALYQLAGLSQNPCDVGSRQQL